MQRGPASATKRIESPRCISAQEIAHSSAAHGAESVNCGVRLFSNDRGEFLKRSTEGVSLMLARRLYLPDGGGDSARYPRRARAHAPANLISQRA